MIYFVRHAETINNVLDLFYKEEEEVGLTEKGLKQAEATAEKLKNIKFDACYCSPKKRAIQTMEKLIKYHPYLKVIIDERIRERTYGEASGMPSSVCQTKRWHRYKKFKFKGVETVDEVFARAKSFYDEVYQKDKNILVVSHSGFGKVTYCYFNGFPENNDLGKFVIKNASVVIFEKNTLE